MGNHARSTAAPMTICTECRHHANTKSGTSSAGPPPDTWFYQVCTHPDLERPSTVDPVDGTVKYMMRNDLQNTVLVPDKHPYCRDLNDGACRMFEAKSTEDADARLKSRATKLWGQWDEVKEHPSGNGLRFYREGEHLGTVWRG